MKAITSILVAQMLLALVSAQASATVPEFIYPTQAFAYSCQMEIRTSWGRPATTATRLHNGSTSIVADFEISSTGSYEGRFVTLSVDSKDLVFRQVERPRRGSLNVAPTSDLARIVVLYNKLSDGRFQMNVNLAIESESPNELVRTSSYANRSVLLGEDTEFELSAHTSQSVTSQMVNWSSAGATVRCRKKN